MREQVIRMVEEQKAVAIVRGISPEKILRVAEALYNGGLRMMEVTFDQKHPETFFNTCDAISTIASKYQGAMCVGAGTVITTRLAEMAHDAGAQFIVSPDANVDVIRTTRDLDMVSMPGAMTPTEILTAHFAGADYVKLFPVGNMGPAYVKAIRAPISHVRMLAVGGINAGNVRAFLDAGCCGAGIGGNLANRAWIEAGEFEKITEEAKKILAAVQ